MTTMKVTFETDVGTILPLYFYIYNTDLANRWKSLIEENKELAKNLNAKFTNRTYKDIPSVLKELNECVNIINLTYDKTLPLFDNFEELNTDILNYLHEEYEIYGDRIPELTNPVTFWNKTLHNSFLRLNELIHLTEDVIKSKTAKFSNMAVLFDYYPQEIFSPILERDKLYLKGDLQWGKVYLGYNTLGKDWLKVQIDNDVDVVARDQVRPQRRFAAETWINFGPDSTPYWSYLDFENWYLQLPENLQKKVPIDDLNELTFGRFLIGEIIIEKTMLNFEPNEDVWKIPSGETKKRWNQEVFTTFRKIKNVEFV